MQAIKGMNATYAVLVVKHNCGYVTWPTNVSLPSGARYPYGVHNSMTPDVDVVGQFLAACRLYGVKPVRYVEHCETLSWIGIICHRLSRPHDEVAVDTYDETPRQTQIQAFYYSIATNIFLNVWSLKVQTSAQNPLLPGQANVTQAQYWDIVLAQLEELWSTYGGNEIFEVWYVAFSRLLCL